MPECHLQVPDTAQIVISIGHVSGAMKIVQHAVVTPSFAPTPTIASNLLTRITALASSSGLNAFIANTCGFAGLSIRDLRQPNLGLVDATAGSLTGGATADMLPRQMAACMTLRTARAGRSYRGRSYWPGMAETANDVTNHYTTAFQTAFAAFCSGYISAFNGDGMTLGVMSRPIFIRDEQSCVIGTPGFTTPVTSVLSRDNLWESQRRRRA